MVKLDDLLHERRMTLTELAERVGMTLAMIRAFVEVFPQAVLLSGAQPNLQLVGTNGSRIEIDPARKPVTLVLRGWRVRRWGFQTRGGWIPWPEYKDHKAS